jgi:predicted MFS family arabinose efflux permease
VGRLTDRLGSSAMSWIGAGLTITVIWLWFINHVPAIPAMVLFVAFMGSMSVRGVPVRTLDTKIPLPNERAAFMSLQSAVQHISLALAAGLSSMWLTERPDKSLDGVPTLGVVAVCFAVLLPIFVTITERLLKRTTHGVAPLPTAGAPVTAPVPPQADRLP